MKKYNRDEIVNFAKGAQNSIESTKLHALHRLIQSKGEPMQTEEKKLNGVKVLNIGDGFYFGMIRKGGKNFFPCMIDSILLTT